MTDQYLNQRQRKAVLALGRSVRLLFAALACWIAATTAGCTPAQRQAVERALNDFSQSADGQDILANSINWLAERYVTVESVSRIDLREVSGKDKMGNEFHNGPVVGSWHIGQVSVKALPNKQVAIAMSGAGYIGNGVCHNATFVAEFEMVYETHVELCDEYWAKVEYRPVEVRKANVTVLRLTVLEGPLVSLIMKRLDWTLSVLTLGLIENAATGLTHLAADAMGLYKLRKNLQLGFTFVFDRTNRARHWLGLGFDPGLPPEPYTVTGNAKKVVDQYVKLWKRGRLFVGPITVPAGKLLHVVAEVDKRQFKWGLDFYVADDQISRKELVSYLDEKYLADEDRLVISHGGPYSWNYAYRPPAETRVWVIVDFTDQGPAKVPNTWFGAPTELKLYAGIE